VDLRIRGIVELLRHVRPRRVLGDLFGLFHRAAHTLRAFGENKFRPKNFQKLAPFHAHRFRHGQDEFIAARRCDKGKRDPGISACGLHNKAAGSQLAAFFSGFDHRDTDPVLYTSKGIGGFKLDQDCRIQTLCQTV